MKFAAVDPVEIDFVTQTSITETKSKILAALQKQGGKLKVESAQDVVAGFGSDFWRRFLGVARNCWPRDVVVRLRETAHGIEVRLTVRDTAGFCDRGVFAEKLQQIMYQQALDIKSQFADADSPRGEQKGAF